MLGTQSIGCLLHVACPRQYKVILFQYLNKPQKQTLSWQMNSSQKFIFLPYEEFSLHMRYLHLLRIWLRYHTPWTLECHLHGIWDCLPLRPSWNQDLSMSSLCPLRPLWSQLLCSENIEYHDKISMKITLIFSKFAFTVTTLELSRTLRIISCYKILICDTTQNLIAIKKLRLTEVRNSSLTSMHLEITYNSLIWNEIADRMQNFTEYCHSSFQYITTLPLHLNNINRRKSVRWKIWY